MHVTESWFVHICRIEAQTSAEYFGGGGEAGTPAHQYGFRGAGVGVAAGACASAESPNMRAATTPPSTQRKPLAILSLLAFVFATQAKPRRVDIVNEVLFIESPPA